MTYTLYIKHYCEACDYVKTLLTDLELDYVELKLDEDFTLEEYKDKFGELSCPAILKDGELVGPVSSLVSQLVEAGLVQKQVVTEDDLPDGLDRTNTIF